MVNKKNLGMGLDLLLTTADGKKTLLSDAISTNKILLGLAVDKDEKGEVFEAYYLYRRVIDCLEEPKHSDSPELCLLASQALNNAAIILFENENHEIARQYLLRAIKLDPANQTALENLKAIAG